MRMRISSFPIQFAVKTGLKGRVVQEQKEIRRVGENDGLYRGSQSIQQHCYYCLMQDIKTGGCQNQGDAKFKVGGLDHNEEYRVVFLPTSGSYINL